MILSFVLLMSFSLVPRHGAAITTVTIQVGETYEIPLNAQVGDVVKYFFTVNGPVMFVISHSGQGKLLSEVAVQDVVVAGKVNATTDGTFTLRFENLDPNDPVELTYSVYEADSSMTVALLVAGVVAFSGLLCALLAYLYTRSRP